jgi:hypothetical protein
MLLRGPNLRTGGRAGAARGPGLRAVYQYHKKPVNAGSTKWTNWKHAAHADRYRCCYRSWDLVKKKKKTVLNWKVKSTLQLGHNEYV